WCGRRRVPCSRSAPPRNGSPRRSTAPRRSRRPTTWSTPSAGRARTPRAARPCCSRQPARASISTAISNIEASTSKNWCARCPRAKARGHDQLSKKLTYDTGLFGAAMLLVVIGLVMIFSASAIIATQKFGAESPYLFLTRQCVFLFGGGALMLILMHVDIRYLSDRRVIYGV